MSFNKIIIVGHLGQDPTLRYTQTGKAVCRFSIATNKTRGDKEIVTWFRVTAWERLAEIVNEFLVKGREVYVEGDVHVEEFTDRDGKQRQSLEVTAEKIHFIGSKNESASEKRSTDKSDPSKLNQTTTNDDDEVPF